MWNVWLFVCENKSMYRVKMYRGKISPEPDWHDFHYRREGMCVLRRYCRSVQFTEVYSYTVIQLYFTYHDLNY